MKTETTTIYDRKLCRYIEFEDRLGQYKTYQKAKQECKRLNSNTGIKHKIVKTIAYRIQSDYEIAEIPCYTITT